MKLYVKVSTQHTASLRTILKVRSEIPYMVWPYLPATCSYVLCVVHHACIGECDCQARVRQGPVGWAVPVHHATLPEPGACAEGGERVLSWLPWLQACDLVPPLQVGLLLLSSLMESATVQVGSENNLVMRWIYSVFPRKGGGGDIPVVSVVIYYATISFHSFSRSFPNSFNCFLLLLKTVGTKWYHFMPSSKCFI